MHIDISATVVTAGAIATAISAMVSLTTTGRAFWKRRLASLKQRRSIPRLVFEMHADVKEVKKKQEFFETELRTNGGSSLKDEVRLLLLDAEMERWDKPWPGFRTMLDGGNISVNQAYCELVGARDPELLLHRSWEQFMFDKAQGDDYLRRWMETSAARSQFADTLKIQNGKGEYRGEWMVRIKPLGPTTKGNHIFGGKMHPHDDKAREIAVASGWDC